MKKRSKNYHKILWSVVAKIEKGKTPVTIRMLEAKMKCKNTQSLEAHRINRDLTKGQGLDSVGNVHVLCKKCYSNMLQGQPPRKEASPIPENVKDAAIKQAGGQCQCERTFCH